MNNNSIKSINNKSKNYVYQLLSVPIKYVYVINISKYY